MCKIINQENSTHLSVSGNKKGDNNGIEIMAKKINQIKDLEEKIIRGDFSIIEEISKAVEGRNNFSFATKFCAYVSNISVNIEDKDRDKFVIYDNIIANVLPYFCWKYLSTSDYINENQKSIIKNKIVNKNGKNDYQSFIKIIDKIIESSSKNTGYKISRRNFDKLIWYFYKGDSELIEYALSFIKK